MIDDIDRKIIKALSRDARISNVHLARQMNLAKSTIARRMEVLLHKNIISIKALPNPYKMGYKASAVIGLDVDLNQIDILCSTLVKNLQLSLIVNTFGRFDVLIIADYPNFELLNHFIKQELPQMQGILRAEPYFVSETIKRYSGMFQNVALSNDVVKIDEIDNKIFEELAENGRIPYSKLAEDLGISIATISRRVAFLVKTEMIKITVVPNPAKFGYLAIAGIFLHTEFAKINEIATKLAESSETQVVMKLTNSFDFFFIVQSANPEKLYQYLKNIIAKIDGVRNIETFIVSDIVKLSTTSTGLKLS